MFADAEEATEADMASDTASADCWVDGTAVGLGSVDCIMGGGCSGWLLRRLAGSGGG